jgi:hypothetical protein
MNPLPIRPDPFKVAKAAKPVPAPLKPRVVLPDTSYEFDVMDAEMFDELEQLQRQQEEKDAIMEDTYDFPSEISPEELLQAAEEAERASASEPGHLSRKAPSFPGGATGSTVNGDHNVAPSGGSSNKPASPSPTFQAFSCSSGPSLPAVEDVPMPERGPAQGVVDLSTDDSDDEPLAKPRAKANGNKKKAKKPKSKVIELSSD